MEKIKKAVSLKDLTTFKIGGPAQYFIEAASKTDLKRAVQWAKANTLPFFVLGGGSNLLVADQGFKGLIVKIANYRLQIADCNPKFKLIEAGSGTSLANLVEFTAKQGLSGLEWASGIPRATAGGAAYINAGAFGRAMADIIKRVEVFDSQLQEFKILSFADCQFNYKESIFQKKKNLIIWSIVLQLARREPAEIKKEVDRVLHYRQTHHPMNFPSAGSIFKNPSQASAALLIEQCGLKGKKISQAQISRQHANFIINLKGGSAEDVLKLIQASKVKVKEKFGVNLEEEICFLGF